MDSKQIDLLIAEVKLLRETIEEAAATLPITQLTEEFRRLSTELARQGNEHRPRATGPLWVPAPDTEACFNTTPTVEPRNDKTEAGNE